MAISQYDQLNYAQFQPLSMQEIWAAPQALRAQHDQLAEEFAQQEQAGGLSLLGLKEGIDDEAIKIHKAYMDETKRAADELATKGFIDSGRRRNLYGLKQQYNQNVVPLQNQLKIRQERAEELRRMQLQDPTFRATLNPNEIGLTSGLKNPEAFNYSGVSGNQMYKSVAEKANQLSKVIEQNHPELIKSKLAYNYFTAVQSGASLEQVDAAMRRQFNPKDVDKMTNLMRGVVESTFNEFGVPQKFANNPQVQDELWQTASQGLYAALGQKQFGTMHDSWGEGNARKAQEQQQQQPPQLPKLGVNYAPDITDKDEYNRLTEISKGAKGLISKSNITGVSPTGGVQYSYNDKSSAESTNRYKNELVSIAKKNGMLGLFKTSTTGKMSKADYESAVDLVISAEQERLKAATPTYTLATGDSNISKSISQALKSGTVTLPKNGSSELNSKKFMELEKAYGAPVITLSATGNGVDINFGDDNTFKADGSIFQNKEVSDAVNRAQKFNKEMRSYILNPEKLKNLPKDNGNYILDLTPYGGSVTIIPPSILNTKELYSYISGVSQQLTQNMLINTFGNIASQNTGSTIKN